MIHCQKEPAGSAAASGPGIDVVLFDYGQVLSAPPDEEAWRRMISISGLGGDTLHEAYWTLRHDYDRGEYNGREYWLALAKHAGVAFDGIQISALLELDVDLWAQPNPPMIAWANHLQNAGGRTAILSNIGDAMAEGLIARLEWLQGFERCIWSYALRLAKPDAAIFREAAAILNTPAERILFIDDKQENITSAQAVGMKAVHYTTQPGFEAAMHRHGLAELWRAPWSLK